MSNELCKLQVFAGGLRQHLKAFAGTFSAKYRPSSYQIRTSAEAYFRKSFPGNLLPAVCGVSMSTYAGDPNMFELYPATESGAAKVNKILGLPHEARWTIVLPRTILEANPILGAPRSGFGRVRGP